MVSSRLSFIIVGFVLPCASAQEVVITRVGGQSAVGEWEAFESGNLRLRGTEDIKAIPLDEVVSVEFRTHGNGASVQNQLTIGPVGAWMFLADGGVLLGALSGKAPASVKAQTRLSNETLLPFESLAGVRLADRREFPRAEALFDQALRNRLPGQDVLITRSAEEPKCLRGRLDELDADRGAFALGDVGGGRPAARTFATEKIYGVIFASGSGAKGDRSAHFELSDGSTFSGRILEGRGNSIRVAASFGSTLDLPIEWLSAIRFQSDRIVFLSDLTPSAERVEGQLHRPWPMQRNRNVAGGPIVLNGRTFEKGLGVHARTELVYELDGAFEFFAATLGLDDSVRPRGNVLFRVLGERSGSGPDGAAPVVLFDSGTVTGVDAPRDVLIELQGIQRLTLIVDYADDLDLADHANWAEARLIRPKTESTSAPKAMNGP